LRIKFDLKKESKNFIKKLITSSNIQNIVKNSLSFFSSINLTTSTSSNSQIKNSNIYHLSSIYKSFIMSEKFRSLKEAGGKLKEARGTK